MSTSKQDYDAKDASASYEQRGVEKYDGAGVLQYRRHQDSMKAEKAAEQAKKKRRKN